MKKYDLILASAVLFIALVWFLINNSISEKGELVRVYQDNILIDEISISDDIENSVYLDGVEILRYRIADSNVDVLYSTCKDKLCVHQRSISKTGETIVCLPNRIIIKIDNNTKDSSYDAVSY